MEVEDTKYYKAPYNLYAPYVYENEQGDKTGYMIKLLNVLKRYDDINVTLIRNSDKLWGAKVGSSWNGLLGMLKRNEGDFSLNPLLLSTDSFSAFPTSHPFLISTTKILFGTNVSNENDIFSVVDQRIIVVFVGFALLIYTIGKLNSKYGKLKSDLPWPFLLQCLLGTSPQDIKCKGNTRFLSSMWTLASFILLLFVSSEMTSQFSSKTVGAPFDTIDDIFHFPNAKPLMTRNNAVHTFFKKNALTNSAFAEAMKRAEAHPDSCYQKFRNIEKRSEIHSGIENREIFYISVDSALWRIIKTKYAKTGNCNMKLSKPLMITYSAMYFNQNISKTLIQTVNRRLRQLTEADCFVDLNPSFNSEMHPCQKPEMPDAFVVINVSAFMIILRVCLLGFSASLISLILEICLNMF